jgi:hypothetical protein
VALDTVPNYISSVYSSGGCRDSRPRSCSSFAVEHPKPSSWLPLHVDRCNATTYIPPFIAVSGITASVSPCMDCSHQEADGDPAEWASSRGELHPPALSEPDVTVSCHPAPIIRPWAPFALSPTPRAKHYTKSTCRRPHIARRSRTSLTLRPVWRNRSRGPARDRWECWTPRLGYEAAAPSWARREGRTGPGFPERRARRDGGARANPGLLRMEWGAAAADDSHGAPVGGRNPTAAREAACGVSSSSTGEGGRRAQAVES